MHLLIKIKKAPAVLLLATKKPKMASGHRGKRFQVGQIVDYKVLDIRCQPITKFKVKIEEVVKTLNPQNGIYLSDYNVRAIESGMGMRMIPPHNLWEIDPFEGHSSFEEDKENTPPSAVEEPGEATEPPAKKHKRHAEVSPEELERKLENTTSKNTKQNTSWAVKVLKGNSLASNHHSIYQYI